MEVRGDTLYVSSQELSEGMVDLEMALDDFGWTRIAISDDDFTETHRARIVDICRSMSVSNPLIKSGLGLRAAYVWSYGVGIEYGSKAVQDYLEAWMTSVPVRDALAGTDARQTAERALGTDGEWYMALHTDLTTGEVTPVSLDSLEITDVIRDPENASLPQYYVRTFYRRGESVPTTVLYPDLMYRPVLRPRTDDKEHVIRWDQPIRAIAVNRPSRSPRGVPDAYSALSFARLSREFLEDWAILMKALSKFAFRTQTSASKVRETARQTNIQRSSAGNPRGVGENFVSDPGTKLEAIPKTSATVDASSSKPLQVMVAAALEVPYTMLTGDPSSEGARAVAETLNEPYQLRMQSRRDLWGEAWLDILNYVVDASIKAPAGVLQGTVRLSPNGRQTMELAGGEDRTITVTWPPYATATIDPTLFADSVDLLPPETRARLLCQVFHIEDVDGVIAMMTQADGSWKDTVLQQQAALDAQRTAQVAQDAIPA